jgi:hypothetical protein
MRSQFVHQDNHLPSDSKLEPSALFLFKALGLLSALVSALACRKT